MLDVTLSVDGGLREIGDEATVDLTMKNVGSQVAGDVSYEFSLPDGVEFAQGSQALGSVGDLAPGDQRIVSVRVGLSGGYGDASTADGESLAATGDGSVAGALAILILAAICAMLACKRSRNVVLSVLLVCSLTGVLSVVPADSAQAQEKNGKAETSCSLSIGDGQAVIGVWCPMVDILPIAVMEMEGAAVPEDRMTKASYIRMM